MDPKVVGRIGQPPRIPPPGVPPPGVGFAGNLPPIAPRDPVDPEPKTLRVELGVSPGLWWLLIFLVFAIIWLKA